jgi:hypothetical protein
MPQQLFFDKIQELQESKKTLKVAFALDPVTLELIKVGGSLILGFLQSKKNDNSKWIEQVDLKLNEIKKTLIEISNTLNSLKVFIDAKFKEFIEIKLISRIETINFVNKQWRRENDKFLKTPETQKEIQELLFALLQDINEAKKYGYGHYDSIALAFRTLMYLMFLSDRTTEIDTFINDTKQYFQECIDPTKDDVDKFSLTFARVSLENEVTQLKNEYVPGRYLLRSFETNIGSGEGRSRYRIDEFQIISGDFEKGFTMTPERVETFLRDNPPIEGGGGRHKDATNSVQEIFNFHEERHPLDATSTTDKFSDFKNKESHFKNVLRPNISTLKLGEESVQNYINRFDDYLKE